MLAGKRAAKFRDQIGDIRHGGAESGDTGLGEEIEVDAAMDTAFAEMSVVGRSGQLMAIERLLEAPQILAETGRRNRAIFRARPSPRIAGNQRAGAEARFAQAPYRKLFAAIKQHGTANAGGIARRLPAPSDARVRELRLHRAPPSSMIRKARPSGQHPHGVEAFGLANSGKRSSKPSSASGRWLEQPRHLIGGDENVVKAQHDQREPAGLGHDADGRLEDNGERAFRTHDGAREIEAAFGQ